MHAIIYTFEIYPEKEAQFIESWAELTELIKKYEGGLGSRLHRIDATNFLAYAQWPSEEKRVKSGDNLPEIAAEIRKRMRNACVKVEAIYPMEVVKDLLVK